MGARGGASAGSKGRPPRTQHVPPTEVSLLSAQDSGETERTTEIEESSSGNSQMKTYLLTWNPDRWTWPDFKLAVRQVALGTPYETRWSIGNSRGIEPGDRVFLLRQPVDRGLIGSGTATSLTYQVRSPASSSIRLHLPNSRTSAIFMTASLPTNLWIVINPSVAKRPY
jgi:hypothetical protein